MSAAEEAEPPSPRDANGAVDLDRPLAADPADAAPARLEAGGLLAEWQAALEPSLFDIPVGNPYARDSAAGFARLCSASLFSAIPAEDKRALASAVIAECPVRTQAHPNPADSRGRFPRDACDYSARRSPRRWVPWSPSPQPTPPATGSSSWTRATNLAPAR